jgi:predicted NBD/HSP70 family sugar kinase
LGEKVYGGGRGLADLIFLNLSVGIGAGIIMNHQVYNGTNGYAGEVGLMVLRSEDERQCAVGHPGCFETLCGAGAVLQRVQSEASDELFERLGVAKQRLEINDLSNPFIIKDPVVAKILADVANLIGIAIANMVSLFNISKVILGGELAAVISLEIINRRVKQCLIPEIGEAVQVSHSTMREDPPLMGVYALVLDKLFLTDEWLQGQ